MKPIQTSQLPGIPGEVRWGLFQEFVFHLRFLDQSLRFAEAGSLAEIKRRFLIGVFLPVGEFLPLLPCSRATWAIECEFMMTAFTASYLNSRENFLRF